MCGFAADVDVVGAFTAAQPDTCRRVSSQPPTGGHLPQVGRTGGPGPQPPVGRSGDEDVVVGDGCGVVQTFEKGGVQPAGRHIVVGEYEPEEVDVGAHAQHRGVGEGIIETP